jgi:5'(3')-deoxyribonucleotidase
MDSGARYLSEFCFRSLIAPKHCPVNMQWILTYFTHITYRHILAARNEHIFQDLSIVQDGFKLQVIT